MGWCGCAVPHNSNSLCRRSGGAHFLHEFSCSTLIEFASEELTDLGRLCIELFDTGQFNSIINFAAARRSGEPISTAQTESAVYRLLHRRITAKQQMRW